MSEDKVHRPGTEVSPYADTSGAEAAGSPPNAGVLPLNLVPADFYDIEAEQGRGGIGVVLRARDRRLDRVVALKQLQVTTTSAQVRFEREMRLTARLQHPGIVP